jgi:hypothetical protein
MARNPPTEAYLVFISREKTCVLGLAYLYDSDATKKDRLALRQSDNSF